jgi:hypothetical protein
LEKQGATSTDMNKVKNEKDKSGSSGKGECRR